MRIASLLLAKRLIQHDITAYDKHQNLSGHSLFSTNSMKFPLIMHSKFVWPNLILLDICLGLVWLENVLL